MVRPSATGLATAFYRLYLLEALASTTARPATLLAAISAERLPLASGAFGRALQSLLEGGHLVPAPEAARMAVTQRPATQEALTEPSGERSLWREVPSRFVIGEEDHIIPAALQHYMAERARAHRTTEIPGASHALTVAHPAATAHMIREAASVRAVA